MSSGSDERMGLMRERMEFYSGDFIVSIWNCIVVLVLAIYIVDHPYWILIPLLGSDVFLLRLILKYQTAFTAVNQKLMLFELILNQFIFFSLKILTILRLLKYNLLLTPVVSILALPLFIRKYMKTTEDSQLDSGILFIHSNFRLFLFFNVIPISVKLDNLFPLGWEEALLPAIFLHLIAFISAVICLYVLVASITIQHGTNKENIHYFLLLFTGLIYSVLASFVLSKLMYSVQTQENQLFPSLLTLLLFFIALFVLILYMKSALTIHLLNKYTTFQVREISPVLLRKKSYIYFERLSKHSLLAEPKTQALTLCTVCCTENSTAVFMSCGHGGLCYPCSVYIFLKQRACHMCRTPIESIWQLEPKEDGLFEANFETGFR